MNTHQNKNCFYKFINYLNRKYITYLNDESFCRSCSKFKLILIYYAFTSFFLIDEFVVCHLELIMYGKTRWILGFKRIYNFFLFYLFTSLPK